MSTPEITVIVPARDAQGTLGRTLEALARQQGISAYEVIVVDNGSNDDTPGIAERAPVVSRVLRRRRGEGPGAARNAGARVATGRALAFVDADCRPDPQWLSAGLAALGEADLVQGRVLPDPSVRVGPFDRTLTVNGAYGLFESANLFVRPELFERLGGFGAGLEDGGSVRGRPNAPFGEDVIFGWRARRMGARTGFCDRALAYHEVFPQGVAPFVAERLRLRFFPELARLVPELRRELFYGRLFLSKRSAAFDAAVISMLAIRLGRRALALAAALPYGRLLYGDIREAGDPMTAAARALADGVGLAALIAGSARNRSLLL